MKRILSIMLLTIAFCASNKATAQNMDYDYNLSHGQDSVRIYKDISEIRASFTPPTFNGGSVEQFQKMMYVAMAKAWHHIKGQNDNPCGNCLIRVIIDKDGFVNSSEVIESCYAVAEAQMADYARHIPRFSPGMIKGKPVATRIDIRVYWDKGGRAYYEYLPYNI